MGLLGEVRIAKDEDYAKWGIEILVSFRDGEEMNVLSAQRQSGGVRCCLPSSSAGAVPDLTFSRLQERALTTVMYLMSLADLAKAPFALVDEINQGMDQRVERLVHNALVATTCKDDVGQCVALLSCRLSTERPSLTPLENRYFLITPKLLPQLEYHERMKVLIINNVRSHLLSIGTC